MNTPKTLKSPTGCDFRLLSINGEEWTPAKDVCRELGVTWHRGTLNKLSDDQKGVHVMDTPGGPQKTWMVNRHGVRELIRRSRKPEAQVLRRWYDDVIDSVEDTGMYVTESKAKAIQHDLTTDEGTLSYLAELSQQLIKRAQFAEAQVEEMKPIVQAFDTAWESGSAPLGEFYRFVTGQYQNSVSTGKLNRRLAEAGVLVMQHGDWHPAPEYDRFFFLKPGGRNGITYNYQARVKLATRDELAAKIRPLLSV